MCVSLSAVGLGKPEAYGGFSRVWDRGREVKRSPLTLAVSGVCPGNSGFSSVICTSCSSAMVPWQD